MQHTFSGPSLRDSGIFFPAVNLRFVVRKNNPALRISTIRAIGSDDKLTLRIGRIADVA